MRLTTQKSLQPDSDALGAFLSLAGIPQPGTQEHAQWAFEIMQRLAATLTTHGWKFIEQTGPRGTYFLGIGPGGIRIQSAQCLDKREALKDAIRHAHDRQFPTP